MTCTDEGNLDDCSMLELLRYNDRLIWMMAKEAGGKVTISSTTEAAYDPTRAMLIYGCGADQRQTIEAVERPA
ncbi:hypothetical protein ACJMQP_23790 [Rhodopseudomonas palustris]